MLASLIWHCLSFLSYYKYIIEAVIILYYVKSLTHVILVSPWFDIFWSFHCTVNCTQQRHKTTIITLHSHQWSMTRKQHACHYYHWLINYYLHWYTIYVLLYNAWNGNCRLLQWHIICTHAKWWVYWHIGWDIFKTCVGDNRNFCPIQITVRALPSN